MNATRKIFRVVCITLFVLIPALMFSFKLPFYKPEQFNPQVFTAYLVPTILIFLVMYGLFRSIGKGVIIVPFVMAFLIWLFSFTLVGEEKVVLLFLIPVPVISFFYAVGFFTYDVATRKQIVNEESEENSVTR